MKKANFTLRTSGNEIIILYNGKTLKKTSNFKKALRIIALYINQKNIENFELFVYERNKLERIKDFDPEVIINHSAGKINRRGDDDDDFELDDESDDILKRMEDRFGNRNDDDDGDDEFDFKRNNIDTSNSFPHVPHRRPTWTYTSTNNESEIQSIKDNIKNIFRG
jgi:hypothetical protein